MSVLNWIKLKIRAQKLKKVALKNGIYFGDGDRLIINGLLVSEFGYLLRYYSDGESEFFSDRSLIYKLKNKIINKIDFDLFANEETREQIALGLNRSTAEYNLSNLKMIVLALSHYHEAEKVL